MLKAPTSFDERRRIVVPGDSAATLMYCVEHFIEAALSAVQDHGAFYVALSGGSTPKALYQALTQPATVKRVPWNKIHLFWSDERSVGPDHPDSNYHMAMQAGLAKMPIPKEHIHRMVAEEKIETHAERYSSIIHTLLGKRSFDYMMLGMGEDGHTASLFPHTEGLKEMSKLVIANFIPQKNTWRMTLSYPCINASQHIVIYVLGASKNPMLHTIFHSKENNELYPIQKVGTKLHPALWICDKDAADGVF